MSATVGPAMAIQIPVLFVVIRVTMPDLYCKIPDVVGHERRQVGYVCGCKVLKCSNNLFDVRMLEISLTLVRKLLI